MRLTVLLAVFLLSASAWAGTLEYDFENGDWAGWEANGDDGISIVDGVIRLDHISKPGGSLSLAIKEDWTDYNFSADMRLVDIEPGAH